MGGGARRRDRSGGGLAVANKKQGALDRYGVPREEGDRAAWTIDRDGNRLQGAAAINRVLADLGGGWRVLAVPYRLRPLAAAEEAFYRWFAENRHRFHRLGVTPECDRPEANCA